MLGPILRRAEEKQVCIWLAFDRSVTVKAEIFRFEELNVTNNKSGEQWQKFPIGSGIAKTLRIGDHLHVVLVIARPVGSHTSETYKAINFPTDELLAYDIEVIDDNEPKSRGKTLADLGLLGGKNSIVYDRQNNGKRDPMLPTFFLRGKSTPLNFLHGSCRKLHGKGEDCLAAADKVISSSLTDLDKRPSALFLTGDQIYADDVAGPLSNYLTDLGNKLLGWDEQFPGIGEKISEMHMGERQMLVRECAGFTSSASSNHLLSFGEFAAMYLLAWNVENWPERFPDITTVTNGNKKKYHEQIEQLENTRRDLPAVRRVLANIPTYMIFDDHEITDDWNITREWNENVRASKCGKQVVTNGLAAYWVFQGWGNNPASFNDEFVATISDFFANNGNASDAERSAFEDHLWSFKGWTYGAPTNPLTIIADCRTLRHYDSYNGAPQLLSNEGLLSILQTAKEANYQKGDPIIIVLPTPVFGFLLLEALQKAAAKVTGVYKLDLETWYANETGLVNLLSFLVQTFEPRHCIFLSGDVHYGFTISAVFALLQKNDGAVKSLCMNITQLNSSALKTTSLVKIAFVSEIMGRIRQLFPWKQVVRIGWINGGSDRLLSKSLRVKSIPTLHLQIRPRKKENNLMPQEPPDWVEARSIVKASGSAIPFLLISDNNIGLVTIDKDINRIIQRFLVRKATKKEIKIHQTLVEMNHGENRLEGLVRAKIFEFTQKSPVDADLTEGSMRYRSETP